ncbi:MAG TPA: TonB-dependent receptor [Pyrinomonadaceae bacterium]|nr:TonB-dependent receptor [Pyrinomonadaceae bacterium]
MLRKSVALLLMVVCFGLTANSLAAPLPETRPHFRTVSGYVLTQQSERLAGVTLIVRGNFWDARTTSDREGYFRLDVPVGAITLRVEGKNIQPLEKFIGPRDPSENLEIRVDVTIAPLQESVVIQDTTLNPAIDQRNDTIYKNTLFERDDQLVEGLNAGINAGQHEGGGKSLEVRRFGYNLDHGGVNGGLKVLVNGVQQNQGSQGHGQGYLGQLKSLTPELIDDVDILNGPFSAHYGDFSGLGVVHIHLKESLPDQLTLRVHGGNFNSKRLFVAYSPAIERTDSFFAYESAYTDGPFLNPGRYRRDNFTGNYTRHIDAQQSISFKLNVGRNNFFSSGQIPLSEVSAGRLDRFGFIDPFNGGRARTGLFSAYYKKDLASGGILKVDGFLGRSLFDLFSNFTFFLNDPVFGDEIQQHDSRLQEGINAQYLKPHKFLRGQALLTAGGNLHASQIQLGLFPSFERNPNRLALNRAAGIDNPDVLQTNAHANVTNLAGYAQEAIDLLNGRLHLEAGVRWDYFRFRVRNGSNETPTTQETFAGVQSAARFQPKASAAYTISDRVPLTFYVNYGRGINSQDARGVVQQPDSPPIATTDFYQASVAYNKRRFSISTGYFLIDHSNEQVYIPDDGTFEFKGASRATGYEVKASAQLLRYLSVNGGLTQVTNAFFRGTSPRVYVDSAPRLVGNGSVMISGFGGFFAALNYRHVSNYRLDGEDASIRAAGLDVLDFSMRQRIRSWVDFNLSIDNLANKRYFETQNFFESRVHPASPVIAQIHGTPGYSIGFTAGLTFRLGAKK